MHNLNIPHTDKKRVVIVGGGFAGLNLAKKLRKCNQYQVVLIDQNNYHLFKPLLYQVASAGLDPSDVSFPFRKVFRAKRISFSAWDGCWPFIPNRIVWKRRAVQSITTIWSSLQVACLISLV